MVGAMLFFPIVFALTDGQAPVVSLYSNCLLKASLIILRIVHHSEIRTPDWSTADSVSSVFKTATSLSLICSINGNQNKEICISQHYYLLLNIHIEMNCKTIINSILKQSCRTTRVSQSSNDFHCAKKYYPNPKPESVRLSFSYPAQNYLH